MTGWLPPNFADQLTGIHRKGGMHMTDYEILMIVNGTLALLMSFGSLIVALLTFLDKRDKSK